MITYISNNCANLHFFFKENREYDHPMIGCLFVNDEDYINFCTNFLYYMSVEPIFGEPRKNSKWAIQNKGIWYKHDEIKIPYPVMYLENIEIHWIHETDSNILLEKYKRRRERFLDIKPITVFILSCCDLCNDHTEEEHSKLVSKFLEIKTSIYITREHSDITNNITALNRIELMNGWINETRDRNKSHIPLIHFLENECNDKFLMYEKILKLNNFEIKSISCSTDIHIKNSYIIHPTKEDLHIVIYYISEHFCKIIVRRLDNNCGWDNPIFIKLGKDDIIIPKTHKNYLEYKTKTIEFLEPVTYIEQKIPKVIIQTSENNECKNILQNNAMMTFIELNPEYEYKFFNNIDRRQFIKTFYDLSVVEAYDILVPGAFKADLFRYCYLYIHGGCYFDFKMILRKPLREIIKPTDSFLVCSDYDKNNTMDKNYSKSYLNSLIFSEKNNKVLKDMIYKCVENILHKQEYFINSIETKGCTDILDLTGPTLFYKVLHNTISLENIQFKHFIINNNESLYKNFVIVDFDTKQIICTKTYTTEVSPSHYSILWNKKELFYKNKRIINDYKIYVYPHIYNDIFEFTLNSRILTVNRYDGGWWLDLNIKIINNTSSKEQIVNVGRGQPPKIVLLNDNIFRHESNLSNVFYENTVKSDDIKTTDIIIAITSIIHVSDFPMGNNEKRSLVSPRDRFTQTIDQINMVRKHIPSATIILLEMSLNLPDIELQELSLLCDYIIRYNSDLSFFYCQKHHNKSLGEMHVMIHLGNIIENKDFKWFCKLNGRYKFTTKFNIQKFLNDCPTSNCIKGNGRLKILSQTIFYSIPKRYYKLYKEHFNVWLDTNTTEPVEHIFTMFLECIKTIKLVDTLDIEGIGAAHGLHMIF
jgi:mannosyltransferase OCH1-like enzyme